MGISCWCDGALANPHGINAHGKEKDPHLAGLLPHKAGSSKEIIPDSLIAAAKQAAGNVSHGNSSKGRGHPTLTQVRWIQKNAKGFR